MSLFPYNLHKRNERVDGFWETQWQGSPIDFSEATQLADRIFTWHSNNKTDDWTESNDGADEDIRNIALGLISVLAEPSMVRIIATIGEQVQQSLHTILVNAQNGTYNEKQIQQLKDLKIWQFNWDEILAEGKKGKEAKRD
jgi:hypothetical protein